ncbi:hypothetical protein AAFC00_000711 [Neodothiora populina]|uniref:RanBD1 domain-containing protein n=1 Tax=Neodothiora populina TaxID=2781224 RepID=A0ABR3PDT1_9PEZI
MSKRFADAQGGSARYGGPEAKDAPDDPPRKATAAQLAKRSIKPLKRGSAASSRSTSPSKPLAPPALNNPFGAPAPAQNSFGASTFSPSPAPPQQQPAFAPPTASSFTFGASTSNSQPASNPFASLSGQSQSFGGFGASQNNTPSFSPLKTAAPTSFSFGATAAAPAPASASNGATSKSFTFGTQPASPAPASPAPAASAPSFSFGGTSSAATPAAATSNTPVVSFNSSSTPKPAEQTPSFSFGSTTPAKPSQPSTAPTFSFGAPAATETPAKTPSFSFGATNTTTPAKPTESQTNTTNMFGQPAANQAISDAEIKEIEDAGPRLASQGRLDELERIVRESDEKYKSATSLAGLDLKELPIEAQRNLLSYVRNPVPSTNASTPKPQIMAPSTPAAPTPSNPFANLARATPQQPAPAAPASAAVNTVDSTPKPAANGLGNSMFGTSTPKPSASAATPAAQPFASFGQSATPASDPFSAQAATPAFKPSSAQAATPLFKPSSAQPPTPAEKPFSAQQAMPAAKPFAPAVQSSAPAALPPPATPAKPSAPLFTPATPATQSSPQKTQPMTPKAQIEPLKKYPAKELIPKNRLLNEAFKLHLSTLDPSEDWGHVIRSYYDEYNKIMNNARLGAIPDAVTKSAATPAAPSNGTVQAQAPAPPASNSTNKRKADDEISKDDPSKRSKGTIDFSKSTSSPNKPFSQTASLFNDILNTPEKAKAPAATPATPSFGGFTPAAPKVAATPSETPKANPFATLTKVNNPPPAPPAAAQTPKTATSSFKPSTNASTTTSGPFKVSTPSASSAAPALSLPKFGSGSAGTTDFMSAFGARAAEEEKKEKEKRKAEDYDSDEDEAEWEKKDAEEQAAKRRKLLEDAASASLKKPTFEAIKPAASGTAAPPKFGSGAAGPNFMSAFGANAADEEKKEREKRKLEDMDSDEDEEEWERKDAEQQAAKRKALADAAAGTRFTFKPAGDSTAKPAAASVFYVGGDKTTDKPASGFTFRSVNQSNDKPAATSFSSNSSASGNIFGHLDSTDDNGDEEESDADADADEDATPAKTPGASLFDRIGKPSSGDKPAAASTPFKFGGASTSGNIFGASNNSSTTSPAGDNTWKGQENTPIKFGTTKAGDVGDGTTTPSGAPAKAASDAATAAGNATAPPQFGGFTATSIHDKPAPKFSFASKSVFGDASKPASAAASGLNASIFSPAGKPSLYGNNAGTPASAGSSVFGGNNSPTSTRDSTPATGGNRTDDAALANKNSANNSAAADSNEPSDEVKDTPPSTDLSALTPEELEANEVVFESKAKAFQFAKADGSTGWQSKGYGMFRLLRDRESGKVWSAMRMTPSGRLMFSFSLLPKKAVKDAYTPLGKRVKMIVAGGGDGKTMETWAVQFGTDEKVQEVVSTMRAGQPEE